MDLSIPIIVGSWVIPISMLISALALLISVVGVIVFIFWACRVDKRSKQANKIADEALAESKKESLKVSVVMGIIDLPAKGFKSGKIIDLKKYADINKLRDRELYYRIKAVNVGNKPIQITAIYFYYSDIDMNSNIDNINEARLPFTGDCSECFISVKELLEKLNECEVDYKKPYFNKLKVIACFKTTTDVIYKSESWVLDRQNVETRV